MNRPGPQFRPPFTGATAALFIGPHLPTTLRDDKPGLPWADMWDLPVGRRAADERPLKTMLRETCGEVGLNLTGVPVLWQRAFPSVADPGRDRWFFIVHLPAQAHVVLGDEGEAWRLMSPDQFLSHPRAIDFLQQRLRVDWPDAAPFLYRRKGLSSSA